MQQGINKVILIGRLGNQPELKYLNNDNSVVNLSLATSERWKDKITGEFKERTEWHQIVLYNNLAERVNNYLTKGAKVYLEGKLQTRKWQDQTGLNKYTTEVIVNNLQMLDTKQNVEHQNKEFPPSVNTKEDQQIKQEYEFKSVNENNTIDDLDDIPF
jgi:single-strand DNA-binding protein